MRILDESTVRQLHLKQKVQCFDLSQYDYVTPQAKAYLKEKRLCVRAENPMAHEDIRPYESCEKAPASANVHAAKPEHMTSLYGTCMVLKSHPRIVFRGKMDTLQAEIVLCQTQLGEGKLCDALEEMLSYTHEILRAEVTNQPFVQEKLLGHTQEEIHQQSHFPKKAFGIDHVFPSKAMGQKAAWMNCLRAKSREAELAAVHAFCRDGEVQREDLLQALNRLSSGFYVLECRCVAGEFEL